MQNKKKFPYEVFQYCKMNFFDKNVKHLLLIHEIAPYKKISETQNGSSTKTFRYFEREKNFDKES